MNQTVALLYVFTADRGSKRKCPTLSTRNLLGKVIYLVHDKTRSITLANGSSESSEL